MKRTPPLKLDIADAVTPKDGEMFAHEWYKRSTASYAMVEAFTAAGVVRWPDNDRLVQERYHDIEDEVTDRLFGELRTIIAETFVRIANEVLARAREREDREE
jgi:hypothetical protein